MHFILAFVAIAIIVIVLLLLGALVLHMIPRMGPFGKTVSVALCRAPALDLVVAYFTVLPLIYGPWCAHWAGFFGAVAGQVASLLIWSHVHEYYRRDAAGQPKIVDVLNRIVGRWRNHTAVWLTAIVTPLFSLVRAAEVFVYPPIAWLVGFPRYNQGDWVNVSRHKFSGLVGHDLIWCLYCDWMTGVWSLGSEMLRNVESFWCPIRFRSDKKCDNCSIDFPDVNHGWVPANGNMAEVVDILEKAHAGPHHGWFGHPVRITVKGNDVA
jgi:hypothetical protein